MDPILHLSLPVRDLEEARAFYVNVLGCTSGRLRDGWIDVWFYGMQVTLQERPEEVVPADAGGARHFGVTLDVDELHALLARLEARPVVWLRETTTDYAGTPQEQTKAKLADPSGNVIELKAYADPAVAFRAQPGSKSA